MEQIAATAISIVAPYLLKGAEEFAHEAGRQALEVAKALTMRLQTWWSKDPVAKAATESLGNNLERNITILSQSLADGMKKDAKFAAEIKKFLSEAEPTIRVIQRVRFARGLTGARIEQFLGGSVNVLQEAEVAENVTGFEAGTVGGQARGN